jgi:hypothetical protein
MLPSLLHLLAGLPIAGILSALVLGWLATSHMTYASGNSPTSSLPAAALRCVQVLDRLLAGQVIIAYGLAKHLAMLREFLAGLADVHEITEPAGSGSGSLPSSAPSSYSSPLGGWLSKAMKAAGTASRVQSRMYGHVVREIAFASGEPATPAAGAAAPSTPTTPMAGLLGMMMRDIAATPRPRNAPARSLPAPTTSAPPRGQRILPPLLASELPTSTESGVGPGAAEAAHPDTFASLGVPSAHSPCRANSFGIASPVGVPSSDPEPKLAEPTLAEPTLAGAATASRAPWLDGEDDSDASDAEADGWEAAAAAPRVVEVQGDAIDAFLGRVQGGEMNGRRAEGEGGMNGRRAEGEGGMNGRRAEGEGGMNGRRAEGEGGL